MAWNGSGENASANKNGKAPRTTSGRRVVLARLLVAAVIAAVGGFLLWRMFNGEDTAKKPRTPRKPHGMLATVAESNLVKKAVTAPVKPKKYKDMTNDEKLRYYEEKYGDNLPENLKPVVYFLKNPPQIQYKMPQRPENIFKHYSERILASFLLIEPGTWVMKPIEFGAKFDSDFAVAINEEIEFKHDDTEDQHDLKLAVVEAKKELAARIRNGENASAIMTELSKQFYELGRYRSNLESQIAKIRRDASMSDQDVQDAVNAANMMLREKGLPNLKMPNMLIRRISLKRAAQKASKKNNL